MKMVHVAIELEKAGSFAHKGGATTSPLHTQL